MFLRGVDYVASEFRFMFVVGYAAGVRAAF